MMMSKKIEVEMVDAEGLAMLLDQRVLLMCGNYFYEGNLEGIGAVIPDSDRICAKLSDVGIVYETGKWDEKNWKDRQQLPGFQYVMIDAIESFGLSPSIIVSE